MKQHKKLQNLIHRNNCKKKVILFVLLIAVITGCSRKNGIYPVESGWDIIYDSHEYRYRCEPDGFYLYTDHGDKELYTAVFFTSCPTKKGDFRHQMMTCT